MPFVYVDKNSKLTVTDNSQFVIIDVSDITPTATPTNTPTTTLVETPTQTPTNTLTLTPTPTETPTETPTPTPTETITPTPTETPTLAPVLYFLGVNSLTANETTASTITFYLSSENINAVNLPMTVPFKVIGQVDKNDFIVGTELSGTFVLLDNNTIVSQTFEVLADSTTEGDETMTLVLTSVAGITCPSEAENLSQSVLIYDTSLFPPGYTLSINPAQANETTNNVFDIKLTTTGVANGTIIPFRMTGVGISAVDFTGVTALTGFFEVTGATVPPDLTPVVTTRTYTITADKITEGTEVLTVTLSSAGGISCPIEAEGLSKQILIFDTSAFILSSTNLTGLFSQGSVASTSNNNEGNIVAFSGTSDSTAGSAAGKVIVYKQTGSTWSTLGQPLYGAVGEQLGTSMSLNGSGNVIAYSVGVSKTTPYSAVYINEYNSTTNTWNSLGTPITASGSITLTNSKVSINDSGDIIAYGIPAFSSSKGQVQMYKYLSGTWTSLGQPLSGAANTDNFGRTISLNSLGTKLAVGSYQNDAGGSNSGCVDVYEYNELSNLWVQIGSKLIGPVSNANFGWSVDLNDVGDVVVVGAPTSAPLTNVGGVYVYYWNGSSWIQRGQTLTTPTNASNDRGAGFTVSINGAGDVIAYYQRGNHRVNYYKYDATSNVWNLLNSSIIHNSNGTGGVLSLNQTGNSASLGSLFSTKAVISVININN